MDSDDLRKVGLKVTMPRVKILQLFSEEKGAHFSADDVYKKLLEMDEEVGVATIYRVLTQFEDVGILQRHNFEGDHAVYELNQGEHHDHMICLECNAVEEFMDPTIEKQQEQIAKSTNFKLTDHTLIMYGLCKQCQ